METVVSLSQIGVYYPQRQSAALTEALFIARKKEFNGIMESLKEETPNSIPQHHLIIAPRGMGKTTLLIRIKIELNKEQYRKKFIPLLLTEEQYNLTDLIELWLNCLDTLLEALEIEGINNNEKILEIEKNIEGIKHKNKDSSELGENLYYYLLSVCNQMGRIPVLLIDNIGFAFQRLGKQEQNILRGYLSEVGCPIVIGAGVAMSGNSDLKEYTVNYKMPFYEFFQAHKLIKLDLNELIEILYNLSKLTQTNIVINSKNKIHLQSLFQLTGGNPRTVVMLFKLLVKGFSDSIIDDLEALLDEATPYNKSRFEDLPARQQIVLNAIAQNWDPIHISELSEITRYNNTELSPDLKRLLESNWIEVTKVDAREWDIKPKMSKENKIKGNVYSISERFLAIWLIMRNGRRQRKNDIRKVLESYKWIYDKKNTEREEILQINKDIIVKEIQEQIENDIEKYCNENNFNEALKIAESIENEEEKQSAIGYICMQSENYIDAEDKFRKALALDNKNSDDWSNLGYCLIYQERYQEAEDVLQQSIRLSKDSGEVYIWSALASSLFYQKKYKEAEDSAIKAVALDKINIDNWRILFKILLAQENYVETEKEIQKMITINQNNSYAWDVAGDCYSVMEKFKEAENAYKYAIQLDENNIKVRINISELYIKLRRIDDAEKQVEEMYLLAPDNSFAITFIANFYVNVIKDKYDIAEKMYKKAIELNNNCPRLWFALSKLYLKLNRYVESEDAIQKIIMLDKNNPNIWNYVGNCYSEIKKYKEAENAYKYAIELDEKNLKARIGLSKLYIKLNRYDIAENVIHEIESYDIDNKYVSVIGQLYYDMNKYVDAEKYLQQAVSLNDTNDDDFNLLGLSLFYQKKYDRVEKVFKKAAEIDKKNPYYLLFLGSSLLLQKKDTEAEDVFRQAVLLDGNNYYFWFCLGKALLYQEKNKEAIEVFYRVIKLEPKNADAFSNLGDAYTNMEDYKKAIECYNKSISIDSNNAIIYNDRGWCYIKIKDSFKAIADFTKAINLDPNFASAFVNRGWEYTYGEYKDYSKAVEDYSKAIKLNDSYNAKKHLIRLYRDIKNQVSMAEELFKTQNSETLKDAYFLEQTLFAIHRKNDGIANDYLSKALSEIGDKLNLKTKSNWEYFAAISIKLGYGKWLLKILFEKGFNIIFAPFVVAIQALEIERTHNQEMAETYLKNQAIEKSEPAQIIIKRMKVYL